MRSISMILACWLMAAVPAAAQERELSLEHTGSLGLSFGVGPQYLTAVKAPGMFSIGRSSSAGWAGALDLGVTMAVGQQGNELALHTRIVRLNDISGESLLFGYRRYFGRDEFKTFASFDLLGSYRPIKSIGGRAAFGVMYDISPVVGWWADAGAAFGLGNGRYFSAEFTCGIQLRSFLLQ